MRPRRPNASTLKEPTMRAALFATSLCISIGSITITVDQMYVRYQVPVGTLGIPITLIHGCCLTGKTWETMGRAFCPA
jgi:hypothetical protein